VTIEDRTNWLFGGLPDTLQVWMSHGDEALSCLLASGAPR